MCYKLTIKILSILLIVLGGFLSVANAAPGDLDTTFSFDGIVREPISKNGNDEIKAIAIQPDGKIVAVGIANYGVSTSCVIARYNSDGSFDSSFDGDGKTFDAIQCFAVAVQADGKIVVAGNFVRNLNADFALVRYNADGSLDTSFDGDGKVTTAVLIGNDYAYNVTVQADGKIVAIGFSYNGVNEDFAAVRYNSNGSLDTSFDGDGKVTTDFLGTTDQARAVAIQTDGKILVGGNAANGTFNNIAIVRYNTDGSLDTAFDSDGKVLTDILIGHDNANSLAVQTDGKIVAAGQSSVGVGWQIGLVRYNPNGSLDTSFDGDGKLTTVVLGNMDLANSVAIQTDGKIVVGGYSGGFVNGFFISAFAVVRYNPNGSLDTSFDGDGKATTVVLSGANVANALAIQTDGKIVAAGYSDNNVSFEKFFSVVRYNPNGSLDTSFDNDGKATNSVGSRVSSAKAVAIQADGKIVVAGNAYFQRNDIDFAVARYNTDGSLDTSFGIGGKVITAPGAADIYDVAHAVAIRSDGKIVVVGESGGATAIVVYNTNGSLDTSFDGDGKLTTNVVVYPQGLAIQANDKIIIGGSGSNGSNVYDIALARFNTDGSFDASFDGDGIVLTDFGDRSDGAFAVKIQTDGKIIAAGFAGNNTEVDFALARYNPDGSLDPSFDGDGKVKTDLLGTTNYIRAVAIQTDGKIVGVGGSFNDSDYGYAIVRYNSNGLLDTSFDDDGKILNSGLNTYEFTAAVGIQADGKIVAAGGIGSNAAANFGLVRYNSNGSLDGSYGTAGKAIFDIYGSDFISGMILDSTGRAVVSGETGGMFTVARVLGGSVTPTANSPYDFDGDGKTDIAIYRPNAGQWWINNSSTGVTSSAQFGNSTDKIVPGDFSGDGKADIAVWRGSTGEWFILRSEDNSFYSVPFGASGDLPVPADFDGDDKADVAVYRRSNFTWYVAKSSGGTQIISFGTTGDVPVVGDYDGDDKADIAIYRPSAGEWWINRSSTSSTSVLQFGNSTDIPVQGDYTGDGRADIAVWRPSTGSWFILRSEDNSFYEVPFGVGGDIPVPGDYDGDGKFDTAVFRPSASNWYINRSTSGILITTFGITGDKPVPSAFLP